MTLPAAADIAREPIETAIQLRLRQIVERIYESGALRLPGLDIGRAYLGAANDFIYGGDLVDVFAYGDGCTAFAVVDITGHGVAAALHAGLVKHALRAYASRGLTALQTVRALNHLCIENTAFELDDDFFATVFFAIIDKDRRHLTYVSAGHDTAYLIAPLTVTALTASGPVIGLMDDELEFSARTIAVSAGDILAIATDGFTEARDRRQIFLGSEALAEIIVAGPVQSAQLSAEAVTRRAYDFTEHNNHDDVAALVIRILDNEAGNDQREVHRNVIHAQRNR